MVTGEPFAFSDQHHVELIRSNLWCGREFGRAAVMVGAGFSRCATRTTEHTPCFPLWRDLAERMQQRLGNAAPSHGSDLTANAALEVADRFEEVFGRTALDAFLAEMIPNEQYYPGKSA